MEKELAITNVIIDTAQRQAVLVKGLRKKARFYNKHPVNKRTVIVKMIIDTLMIAAQIRCIISQHTPKFQKGGI